MRIAVLVKQVPSVETVKIDENTGTMIRDGVESELNPLDLHAIEAAVRIKESRGDKNTEIVAITMGPPMAKKTATYAIAMGCNRGVLLTDRRFGGADTLATARTLAKFLEKEGPFDLIFAGERATDGETGQVGPAVAELLKLPVFTYVSAIDELTDSNIRVVRAVEGGHETLETSLPAFVIPIKEINIPRLCTLDGKIKAKQSEIPTVTADELNLAEDEMGLKGSPTRVVKITYPKVTRQGDKIKASDCFDDVISSILSKLEERSFLEGAR